MNSEKTGGRWGSDKGRMKAGVEGEQGFTWSQGGRSISGGNKWLNRSYV